MTGTIIVVGGPAGTGKTTAASKLSTYFDCPYVEGDALHPQANIIKMSKGIPLTDDDRWDWLITLTEQTAVKCKEDPHNIAIVTCSMLKKSYRQLIKDHGKSFNFVFCFLYASFDELVNRVENRKNHYMKSDMVKSQYEIMEVPEGDELVENGGDCLAINTTGKSLDDIFQEICNTIRVGRVIDK
ncbi:hypothetical protein CANTEDRAFT_113008 [Yamadazyma tenuis ATCC 10573]|uniref:Gluconokinase n=2 Tax=Candida tenuis TaxID=2315449 RepID=G3AZY3_CANTC|nr:carbohydrate kinase [Yamadazyma tenuis ATCC 10573]XP_006685166.1 uncharacterized protein CANTEDRAFT_113008 [Yamadazyma tenuis ATCC 10573]EGV65479.1 carbohydrate kinase [Yamadazyma tenuis ATCC 10573]EGV65480.1 hypothetical protein CANTEDRAFT_113008 [Yamadazyma tenuis ATCC 10573]